MRVAVKIELSDADRQRLKRLSRSRSAARRCGCGSVRGQAGNGPEQGRALEAAVRRRGGRRDCEGASAGWQPRRQGLDGPSGAEARGDPADDADRGAGGTHWSCRSMARAAGDLPPRVVPHPMLVPAPVEGRE